MLLGVDCVNDDGDKGDWEDLKGDEFKKGDEVVKGPKGFS